MPSRRSSPASPPEAFYEPFGGPRDAWEPGGFYGLDMFAPGVGVSSVHIDDETVAIIRRDIR